MGSAILVIALLLLANFWHSKKGKAESDLRSYWVGGIQGTWDDPNNWSLGRVPDKATMVTLQGGVSVVIDSAFGAEASDMVISEASALVLKGNLDLAGDIYVLHKGSLALVQGNMAVDGHVYVMQGATLQIPSSGGVQVVGDLVLEQSRAQIKGTIEIGQDMELRRGASLVAIDSGDCQVGRDMVLYAADGLANQCNLLRGNLNVAGNVAFVANDTREPVAPLLRVDGGKCTLGGVVRNENHEFKEGTNIKMTVNGGELVCRSSLVFDTFSTAVPLMGQGVAPWMADKPYGRKDENHMVEVTHEGKVYFLSDNKWNSKGNEPGVSADWIERGEADGDDFSKDCTLVPTWSAVQAYSAEKDKDIFVEHKGFIYRMNKTCAFSKGNEPGLHGWAWIAWHRCPPGRVYRDILEANGGKVVFHEGWIRKPGIVLGAASTLVIAPGTSPFTFQTGDVIGSLQLEPGAEVTLLGDLRVMGNLLNHSSHPMKGSGLLVLTGGNIQNIAGKSAIMLSKLMVDKDSGEVRLYQDLHITDSLVLVNKAPVLSIAQGPSATSGGPGLHFGPLAGFRGQGWFTGMVSRQGASAFVMPTGSRAGPAYFGIGPTAKTAMHQVRYYEGTPIKYLEPPQGVAQVSTKEYWAVSTGGQGSPAIATAYSGCAVELGLDDPDNLVLLGYNGSEWHSLGNGAAISAALPGGITALDKLGSSVLVTLGNLDENDLWGQDNNPFGLDGANGNNLELTWTDLPTGIGALRVEQAGGQANWEPIIIESPGTYGRYALQGKAADVGLHIVALSNGEVTKTYYAEVTGHLIGNTVGPALSVFPNPFIDRFTMQAQWAAGGEAWWQLANTSGTVLFCDRVDLSAGTQTWTYEAGMSLPPGTYIVGLTASGHRVSKVIVKK